MRAVQSFSDHLSWVLLARGVKAAHLSVGSGEEGNRCCAGRLPRPEVPVSPRGLPAGMESPGSSRSLGQGCSSGRRQCHRGGPSLPACRPHPLRACPWGSPKGAPAAGASALACRAEEGHDIRTGGESWLSGDTEERGWSAGRLRLWRLLHDLS